MDDAFGDARTVLYRLLFLLYAEGRRLLPAGAQSARDVGDEVARVAGPRRAGARARLAAAFSAEPCATTLYDRLFDPRCRLRAGSASRAHALPYYELPFLRAADARGAGDASAASRCLARLKVPDRFLALALDGLARDEDADGNLARIDYASLDVRHLGAIHEGLLASRRPRERKAGGSYYTPDAIVRDAVERAVGPALHEHLERLRASVCITAGQPTADRDTVVDALLRFRVLDPAMGSGHFLVAALDVVSERMLAFLNAVPGSRVQVAFQHRCDRMRAQAQGRDAPIDPDALDDAALLRRLVLKRCIYGVDLDTLAVELARASLWLHCGIPGLSPPFLDHHLKVGDALVGARVEEAGPAATAAWQGPDTKVSCGAIDDCRGEPAQRPLSAMRTRCAGTRSQARLAARLTRAVAARADMILTEVRQSQQDYARATAVVAPYRRLLNASLSRWFGDEAAREEASFFHWEVEFPDVFAATHRQQPRNAEGADSAGFDAIVGNPPWVSYSGRHGLPLAAGAARYYADSFRAARGWLSAQGLFLERAVTLLRDGGRLGLAVPAQLSDLNGFRPLREYLARLGSVEEPCPYHGEDAFAGVTGPAITVIFTRGRAADHQAARWRIADTPHSPPPGAARSPAFPGKEGSAGREPGSLAGSRAGRGGGGERSLREDLLGRLAELEPFGPRSFGDPGVHTGNCGTDLITPNDGPCGVPIREGRDVRPFHLLPPRRHLRLDLVPAPGRYFRIGPARRYTGCPILLRQTASRPIAALHTDAAYFRNSVLACYGVEGLSHAVTVALLNSELFAWLHRCRHRDARQRSFPQVKVGHLAALPKPPLDAIAPAQRTACLRDLDRYATELARLARTVGCAHEDWIALYARVNALVYRLYGVSERAAATIRAALA